MHSATIVSFRPVALPAIGYRVDVHQFDRQTIVIFFQNRAIVSDRMFQSHADADDYARELAADHMCAVIHHRRASLRHGDANSCECLSCQTGRSDYPCLLEDQNA